LKTFGASQTIIAHPAPVLVLFSHWRGVGFGRPAALGTDLEQILQALIYTHGIHQGTGVTS
jgi:hypothetical protein